MEFDEHGVYQQQGNLLFPRNIEKCKPELRYRRGVEDIDIVARVVTLPAFAIFGEKGYAPSFFEKGKHIPKSVLKGEKSIAQYYCEAIYSSSFIEDIADPVDIKNQLVVDMEMSLLTYITLQLPSILVLMFKQYLFHQ